ncbi:MAG: hypothetical protein LBI53_08090 [Candidatus Peribacteria bacterium]|jgi:hypothetical protein|nr:hypothetical protein [Candidatus Peribacteria bacterium]
MKAGDRYRDPVTGEIIEVQCPLQVIMTANEGSKYTIHTNVLQDQIEREIQREYI